MSYILDALKRAEQERQIGQLPNAAITPIHEEYDDEPRRWPWILLAIFLVAAVAAALGVWLSQKQQPSIASTPSEASAPPSVSVVSRSAPASPNYIDRDSDMPSRVVVVTTSPQVLEAPNQTPPPTKEEAVTFSETKPIEEPPEIAAIELLLQPKPKPVATKPKQEPAPRPKPQMAASTAPKAEQPEQRLPLLNEMDYAFRRSVPELSLQFHRYSDDSERSFVLIDGVRYRQGQILSAGPTLERIVDSGLVLRWQGERFIYPTGG